jgi:hypothetical protein
MQQFARFQLSSPDLLYASFHKKYRDTRTKTKWFKKRTVEVEGTGYTILKICQERIPLGEFAVVLNSRSSSPFGGQGGSEFYTFDEISTFLLHQPFFNDAFRELHM